MKRRFLGVLMVAVLVASLSSLAHAWSFRIRLDPNDSPRNTDIRRVVSDLTVNRVYLKIVAWQRLTPWRSHHDEYIIRLDSSGGEGFDRVVEIYPFNGHWTCLVEVFEPFGDPGAVVGDFKAARPSPRSVACSIPRSWFPRIQRAVRFYVSTSDDRAPNTGLYIWI